MVMCDLIGELVYLHDIHAVLDISKHVGLYQSSLDVLSSLASNSSVRHLLTLPVFCSSEQETGDFISLASLTAKLRIITELYHKTAE